MGLTKTMDGWIQLLYPANPSTAISVYARLFGMTGLLVFALGLSMSKSLQLIGLGLLVAGIIFDWRRACLIFKSTPAMYCICIFLIYIWLRTAYGVLFETEMSSSVLIDGARKYSYIVMIPVVGWWLAGSERVVSLFYLVIIMSTVSYILFFSGINLIEFSSGRSSSRNLPTLLLAYAMLCGVLLVWISTFFIKTVSAIKNSLFLRAGMIFFLLFSFIAIFLTLIAIQARTTTASFIVALLLIFPCMIYNALKNKVSTKKVVAISSFFIIVLSSLVIISFDTIKDRYTREIDTFEHLMVFGNLADTPPSSFGQRIHFWALGSSLIKERPLFGHGWGGSELIEKEDRERELELRNTAHFHNTVIEALVAWGIIGTVLLFSVFYFLVRCVFKEWRRGRVSPEMLLFLIGGAVIVVISGMTHSFGIRQTTWTYATMWAGVAFSYCFNFGQANGKDDNEQI